mmetsp:Transcript_24434/g.67900  ORF Transcript_24434/g.67900 Transcript_24434/m.67900 type:complete len:352 (-) Transcript_24434:1605-2660(-)
MSLRAGSCEGCCCCFTARRLSDLLRWIFPEDSLLDLLSLTSEASGEDLTLPMPAGGEAWGGAADAEAAAAASRLRACSSFLARAISRSLAAFALLRAASARSRSRRRRCAMVWLPRRTSGPSTSVASAASRHLASSAMLISGRASAARSAAAAAWRSLLMLVPRLEAEAALVVPRAKIQEDITRDRLRRCLRPRYMAATAITQPQSVSGTMGSSRYCPAPSLERRLRCSCSLRSRSERKVSSDETPKPPKEAMWGCPPGPIVSLPTGSTANPPSEAGCWAFGCWALLPDQLFSCWLRLMPGRESATACKGLPLWRMVIKLPRSCTSRASMLSSRLQMSTQEPSSHPEWAPI